MANLSRVPAALGVEVVLCAAVPRLASGGCSTSSSLALGGLPSGRTSREESAASELGEKMPPTTIGA